MSNALPLKRVVTLLYQRGIFGKPAVEKESAPAPASGDAAPAAEVQPGAEQVTIAVMYLFVYLKCISIFHEIIFFMRV